MADWTTFNLNVFLPGEPLTSAKALAWYENPIAIAEGADDAPRANGKMAATTLEYATENPLTGLSAGDLTLPNEVFEQQTLTATSTTSSTFESAGICEISFRATGTLRFVATQTSRRLQDDPLDPVQTSNSEIRILKNATVIETWSLNAPSSGGTSATSATRTIDISATSGDVFEWEIRRSGGSGSSPPDVTISGFSFRANDTYTTQPLRIKVSEVRP